MTTPRTSTRTSLLVALAASTAMLAACGGAPTVPGTGDTGTAPDDGAQSEAAGGGSSGGDLAIGMPLPYTGEYAWVGENVEAAARPMIDEINAAGGIDGQSITLKRGDTEGTVDAGVLAARKLANTDQVLAFVGPTSLSFTGVRQVIVDTKMPVVTPTAGTVEFDTAGTSLFHRTVPSDSLGGRAIAKALSDPASYMNGATVSNVAVMVGDAPALVSFQEPIEQSLTDYGVDHGRTVSFTVGRESYRSEVSEVLGTDPDVIVLVAAPADSAKIMQQAKQNGYTGTWFVTQDQTNADYIELAGADVAEGIFGLQEAEADTGGDLRQEFEDFLGHAPDIFQTNTYDAVNVTALAMYAAKMDDGEVTRETIEAHIDGVANPDDGDEVVTSFAAGKAALDAGKGIDYQGLSGPVDFDDYGNITAPFEILEVTDGAFAEVTVLAAEDLE